MSRPTTVPGPIVHGPDVNTITRAPCAECDSATSPCATAMATPVARNGRVPGSRGNGSGSSSSRIVCNANSHSDTGKINRRDAALDSATALPLILSYVACSCGLSSSCRRRLSCSCVMSSVPRSTYERGIALSHSSCATTVAPKVTRPTRHSSGSSATSCPTLSLASCSSSADIVVSSTSKKHGGRGFLLSIWYSTVVYPGKSSAGRLFSLISV